MKTLLMDNAIAAEPAVRLVVSPPTWIQDAALRQFYAAAGLAGVRLAVGFPDLHPGTGVPVGAAFVTGDVIYPHLVGRDIGCGITLFKTDLVRRKARVDGWAALPFELEHPWDGDRREFLAEHSLESTKFDHALGTIGGGNHFAELQAVETVFDASAFKELGLGKQQLVGLVHSGSHGLGPGILQNYLNEHSTTGASPDSFAGREYLHAHNLCLRWARANRELIARRFAAALGTQSECLWDGCHNSITQTESALAGNWIHRRGAVAAEGEFVMIPGSRGSLTYVVKPIGDDESHAWSLAHGAGRKWARSESRRLMRERFTPSELLQTPLGGRVICEDHDVLYEEAPLAYKNIQAVIQDLVDAGLVSVVATLRPILTYKTRKLRR